MDQVRTTLPDAAAELLGTPARPGRLLMPCVPDDQHKANPVRAAEIFRNADLTALADKIGEQLAAATLPERKEAHDAKLQVEEFIDQIQEYFTDGYGWAIDENTGEKVVLITKAQRGEVKAAMKGLRDAMHPPPMHPPPARQKSAFGSFNAEGQAARQGAAPQRTNSHEAEMASASERVDEILKRLESGLQQICRLTKTIVDEMPVGKALLSHVSKDHADVGNLSMAQQKVVKERYDVIANVFDSVTARVTDNEFTQQLQCDTGSYP